MTSGIIPATSRAQVNPRQFINEEHAMSFMTTEKLSHFFVRAKVVLATILFYFIFSTKKLKGIADKKSNCILLSDTDFISCHYSIFTLFFIWFILHQACSQGLYIWVYFQKGKLVIWEVIPYEIENIPKGAIKSHRNKDNKIPQWSIRKNDEKI